MPSSSQGPRLLLAEPLGHLSKVEFQSTVVAAQKVGFRIDSLPKIRRSQAVVLVKA